MVGIPILELGLVYTRHRRTLAIKSNDIMIDLTEQGKTWPGNRKCKLMVLLKQILHENVSKIMLGWCSTLESLYIYIWFVKIFFCSIMQG